MQPEDESNEAHSRSGPLLVALVLVLALTRGALVGEVAPFDTTFLGARVVEHLSEGVGARANPGLATPQPAFPVASPLGTALAAFCVWMGTSTIATVLWLPVLFEVLAALLFVLLLRARPLIAGAALVLWIAAPEPALVAAAGGAGPLALALVLATCLIARGPGNARALAAGICAGLATTAAPEAALVLPGVWMAWRRTVGRIGLEAFGFLLVLVPAVLLMQASLGTWRPAPLIDGVPLWGPALPGSAALVLVPLAVLGLRRRSEELIGLRPLLLVGLLAAVPWLLTGRSLQARAGYLPLVALLPAAGVALEPWLKRSLATSRALVAGAAGVLLVTGFALVPREGPRLAEHVWGPLAAWADGAGLGTIDNQLLADEVGMVGWFTGAVVQPAATGDQDLVLQLQGLERLAELRAIHEGSDVKVRYLLLPTTRGKLEALRSSGELSRAWYPIERFSVSGSTGLEPDLLAVPERAQGDYLLFHRRR